MTAMNPVVVQSIWTALSAALFAGILVWVCTRSAGRSFREAERLPFLEEDVDRRDASAEEGR
jgi:hypothetical protein